MKHSYIHRQQPLREEAALKQKALEPSEKRCRILKKEVKVLVEYTDYHGPHNKGPEGALYCENMVECYQKGVKCRYSGISPLYPDPFVEEDENSESSEEDEGNEESLEDLDGEDIQHSKYLDLF